MMNKRKEPEDKTKQRPTKFAAVRLLLAGVVAISALSFASAAAQSQKPLPPLDPATNPHRTRLILKDGSYQIIMSYRIVGNVVRYVSAERGGAEEEIPANLVDFEATRRWEKQHTASAPTDGESGSSQTSAIDPELLKEEADRAALTPEVAKDLRLPEQESTLILDDYQDTPELVPMGQTEGDLNRSTGHNIVRAAINPMSSAHQIVQLKGEKAAIQLHIDTPVLYIRLGDATAAPTGGPPLTVDTHGASSSVKSVPSGGSPNSRYVIVRADVRTGLRIISSFKISLLGSVQRQEDVVETTSEILLGGHWMKLTPRQPLNFGEYALMEVISDKDVNLGVWDFGVHPVAPENRDVIKPEPKRPLTLERRRPE
jgi:hypothetical protein